MRQNPLVRPLRQAVEDIAYRDIPAPKHNTGWVRRTINRVLARMARNVHHNQSALPKGFTAIELIICVAFVAIFLAIASTGIIGPQRTESAANEAAAEFVAKNQIKAKRVTCAHDSDGDGQASCAITEQDNHTIYLSCPVGVLKTAFGATSCKDLIRHDPQLSSRYGTYSPLPPATPQHNPSRLPSLTNKRLPAADATMKLATWQTNPSPR